MSGTLKNSRKSIKDVNKQFQCQQQLSYNRRNASHGEFFFAEFLISNGGIRTSPVFVLSSKKDNNDDVVICSCTKTPARSEFDIYYKLRHDTYIRTNKIYTIHRDKLHFKIGQVDFSTDKYKEIIQHVRLALNL